MAALSGWGLIGRGGEERVLAGRGLPRAPSLPRFQTENDKEKKFLPDPMVTEREIHSSSPFFSLSARGEEREREGNGLGSRVGIARIQNLNLKSDKQRLKNLAKWSPEVLNITKGS
jgi:hypothetical protein